MKRRKTFMGDFMKKRMILTMVFAIGVLLSPLLASAQTVVPHLVNFQAVLRDDNGNLITDPTVDLEFKVLDQDGTQLYYEQQPGVSVVRSAVDVMIGEGIVPGSSPATPTGGVPLTALDPASGAKKLQVKIGNNQPSDPMDLNAVPYAMYAEKALGLVGNIDVSQLPSILTTDDELNTAIQKEVTDRTTSETNLQNQINTANTNITTLTTGLANEVTARTNGDTTLQNAITSEANTRASADTTLQNNINSETSARTTADTNLQNAINGKVSKSGDTMSGVLNMGGNNITNPGTVDGYSVSGTFSNHETRITNLENKAPPTWNDISGQIPDNKVSQYMRPFAFGSVTFNGSGSPPYSFNGASYNVASLNGNSMFVSVTFQNVAPNNGYTVIATYNGNGGNALNVVNRTTTGFQIHANSGAAITPGVDFVVFGNF